MGKRLRSLAFATVLSVCWWGFLGGAPVMAHTELQTSSPKQFSVIDAPPKEVRLTFSEELGGGSLAVAVSGRSAAAGPATVDGADLVLQILPDSPAGAWTVAYRVVSADGHPVTGQFTFTVKQQQPKSTPEPTDTPSSTPIPTAVSTPTPTAAPAGATSGQAHETPTVEIAVAVLALAGLVVGVFVRRRRS